MKFTLFCLAFTIVVVARAAGEGCCTPDEWEGLAVAETGYTRIGGRPDDSLAVNHFEIEDDDNYADLDNYVDSDMAMNLDKRRPRPRPRPRPRRPSFGLVMVSKYIYYDATNNQTAAYVNVTSGKYHGTYFMLQKHENGTGSLYVVDEAKDKCFKRTLKMPFRKVCIPDSAKAFGETYFGAGDSTLRVKSYGMDVRGKKIGAYVTATVTADSCVPVAEGVTGIARKVAFMDTVGFVNIKAEISDPSVFDVPEACQNSTGEIGEEFEWLQSSEYSILRTL